MVSAIGRGIGDGGGVVDVLPGDGLAGQQRAAPAEARRKRDLGIAHGAGSASQIRSSSVPPNVPRRNSRVSLRASSVASIASCGARISVISRAMSASGAMASARIGISLWLKPVTRPPATSRSRRDTELAVRARSNQQRAADLHRCRQCIVRVPGQDDVDALDPPRHLAVDVEAVVRQQHDHLGAQRARMSPPAGARRPRGCRTSSSASSSAGWRLAYKGTPARSRRR